MGFFDAILGRRKQAAPDLDQLFGLPAAAISLQAATNFAPTGVGAVCFRASEGGAFARTQNDIQDLLDADQGPKVELSEDSYGFTWLLARHDPSELSALVTDLHAVNSSLADAGFGPALLCSTVVFADPGGRRLALVYLYKQGTFYPFAPAANSASGEQRRDNSLEIQVRAALGSDVPVEPQLSRWLAVWGAPGL